MNFHHLHTFHQKLCLFDIFRKIISFVWVLDRFSENAVLYEFQWFYDISVRGLLPGDLEKIIIAHGELVLRMRVWLTQQSGLCEI